MYNLPQNFRYPAQISTMTNKDRKREKGRIWMREYRQRQREAAGPPPPRYCLHCEQIFDLGRYLQSDRRRYCSEICRWAAAQQRRSQRRRQIRQQPDASQA